MLYILEITSIHEGQEQKDVYEIDYVPPGEIVGCKVLTAIETQRVHQSHEPPLPPAPPSPLQSPYINRSVSSIAPPLKGAPPIEPTSGPNGYKEETYQIIRYWEEQTGRSAKLFRGSAQEKRRQQIKSRLKEGYTVDECKAVVAYVANDSWHISRGVTDLEYMFRPKHFPKLLMKTQDANPKVYTEEAKFGGNSQKL